MDKGWIIVKDHVSASCRDDHECKLTAYDEVEIVGPRGCTLTKKELMNGVAFRMYDDDDNIYFSGFLVGDENSEDGFMPLDDYGTPDAGCTYIKYRNKKTGKWETL